MLGPDGVPTARFMADLDDLLREHAVRQIDAWDMPTGLPSAGGLDRWRLVSSVQKAIRRGDAWAAMAAAHACHEVDARYLFFRLAVTAVEDVMLGNLYAVALTLALVGSKPARELAGDRKTAVWLAGLLAGGLKDHTACSLCALVSFDRDLHPNALAWAALPDHQLARRAGEGNDASVGEGMLATWLLAGTKRFRGLNLPEDNDRQRWALMRLMAESGMPLILYYVADRTAMRTGDGMFAAILPIWQMVRDREDRGLDLLWPELPAAPMIGPILAPAYDSHTRDGRTALARFARLPVVARYLEPISGRQARLEALWAAVFAAEGGMLNASVSTPSMRRVHLDAIRTELAYRGLKSASQQAGLIGAIHDHVGALHDIRRDVVTSHHPGEATEPPTDYQAPKSPELKSHPNPQAQGDKAAPDASGQLKPRLS
jgi:hypothetical protein